MPPTFPKIEPVSKKVRVVAMVRDAIISGKIQAGEQIVEAKLAQQFGVGQGLIREALIDLEHHGFVQRTPFSGTQVSKLSLDDARQIFDLRIELEPLAFFLAGQKAGSLDLDSLQDLAEKTRAASTSEDVFAFFEHHLSFRKMVWGLSGNRYLCQSLERLVVPLYALYLIRRTYNSEGIVQTMVECVEHQDQLLQAYRSGDLDEVRKVARKFLVRMKGYLGSRL